MRHEREHRRMARPAGEGGADLAAPPGELGRRDARVADLVGDVVDLAAESVEGGDRSAPRRGEEEERVVEARAAGGRLVLHVLLGRNGHRRYERSVPGDGADAASASGRARIASARQAMAGASRQPSAGRVSKVAPPSRSIRSRTRSPPCTTRRSSQPARPGIAWTSGAPRQHQRARPGDELADERVHPLAVAAREKLLAGDAVARRVGGGHVEPAAARVEAEVLPEVGELQRRADRVRAGQRTRCRRRRKDGAAAGRSGSPSAGSSRAAAPDRRSASAARPAEMRRADRRAAAAAGDARRWPRRAARRPRASAATARAPRRRRAGRRGTRPGRRRARPASRRLRRRCRRRCARNGRSRRSAGAAPAGRARRQPESSRSDRRSPARFSTAARTRRQPGFGAAPRAGKLAGCPRPYPGPLQAVAQRPAVPLTFIRAGGEIGRRTRFRS